MGFLRAFLNDHRRLALTLVALVLCMKIVVPSGFMVSGGGKTLSITICNGQGPEQIRQISLPRTNPSHQKSGEQGKVPDACPYAALAMAAVSGAQVALLVLVLAFILVRGVWPAASLQVAPRFFSGRRCARRRLGAEQLRLQGGRLRPPL